MKADSKHILIKGVAFFCLFIGINLMLTLYFTQLRPDSSDTNRTKYITFYKRKKEIKYLFLGHSRVANGINTRSIPGSFQFASGGETFQLNYYKLKFLLEHPKNPIGCVILPAGNNALKISDRQLDLYAWFWKDKVNFSEYGRLKGEWFSYMGDKAMITLFPYYQIALRRLADLSRNGVKRLNNVFPRPVKGFIFKRFVGPRVKDVKRGEERDFSKWPEQLKKTLLAELVEKHFPDGQLVDPLALIYLQKTINLCKAYDIPLVLLKYPLTRAYRESAEAATRNSSFSQLDVDSIVAEMTGGPLLDFSDYYDNDPALFRDLQHLNKSGKVVFSEMLNDTLPSVLRLKTK
jgi:hypothetical protein